MKRSPFNLAMVVLAYLAAGAVVNVVVAAGCALWMPLDAAPSSETECLPTFATRWIPNEWLVSRVDSSFQGDGDWCKLFMAEREGLGVSFVVISAAISRRGAFAVHDPRDFQRVVLVRSGWPWKCIEAARPAEIEPRQRRRTTVLPADFSPALQLLPGGTAVDARSPSHYPALDLSNVTRNFIPLSTVWPAMVADTIVWALILAALVRGPRWARGELRMRRGLCRSCGYPIGVADRCTECGHALPKWLVRVRMPEGAAAPSGTSPTEKQIDREVA